MSSYDESKLREIFDASKPWHHHILVKGVATKVEPAWGEPLEHPRQMANELEPVLDNVEGKRVLDVGCNDGFFVFHCRERGASSVCGIEAEAHHYKNANLVNDLLQQGSIELRCMSAYEIDESLGEFDISLLLGLIYHLKNPLKVIESVAHLTNETLVIETALRNSLVDIKNREKGIMGTPSMDFLEHPLEPMSDTAHLENCYNPQISFEGAYNWWVPNSECVCSMLRSVGFQKTEILQENIGHPSLPPPNFGRAIIVGRK